jgi:hypothetical protein
MLARRHSDVCVSTPRLHSPPVKEFGCCSFVVNPRFRTCYWLKCRDTDLEWDYEHISSVLWTLFGLARCELSLTLLPVPICNVIFHWFSYDRWTACYVVTWYELVAVVRVADGGRMLTVVTILDDRWWSARIR